MKDNTQKVFNIIDSATDKNIPLLWFFADSEKAFDRMEWVD